MAHNKSDTRLTDEYGFYDPDQLDEHIINDLEFHMGRTSKYTNATHEVQIKLLNDEYQSLMQLLN